MQQINQWSDEQHIILEAWRGTTDNIVVGSNAGTGKTTVIVECMNMCQQPALYVVFMRNAANEAISRLGEDTIHTANTLNTLGSQLLKAYWAERGVRARPYDAEKYEKIVKSILEARGKLFLERDIEFCARVLSLVRSTLTDYTDWDDVHTICELYGISIEDASTYEVVQEAMEQGRDSLLNRGWADFDDQIYYPIVLDMQPKCLYPYVFIDEVQDLSEAKFQLAMKFLAPGGRVMAVGDRKQSVMLFAGAHPRAFDMIKQQLRAVEYEMTESRRFGPRIAAEAQQIVPRLTGRNPNSRDQVVTRVGLPQSFEPNSAIIARSNAPLVAAAIEMHKRGQPCVLKNPELQKRINKYAWGIIKRSNFTWDEFPQHLAAYRDWCLDKMYADGIREKTIEAFRDCIDCIERAYQVADARDEKEFLKIVSAIFEQNDGPFLTTAHASKGGQWDHVYLIEYAEFERYRAEDNDYAREQTDNVRYVALTRPRQTLNYVL